MSSDRLAALEIVQDCRRRPWPASLATGSVITGLFILIAILSRFWTPQPPTHIRIGLRLGAPLEAGLLGTDQFGRDVLSMLMAGTWNSLTTAFLSVLLGLVFGVAMGTTAAAVRGRIEEITMRSADLIFAFPALITAIMITNILGPGQATAVTAIGIFIVPVFARVSRGAALQIWARDYCLAARAAGKGRILITIEHVIPNIAGTLLVQATIQLALAILIEAGLSFLGLGLPPPNPSWGRMLNEAQTFLGTAPWLAIAPGATIAMAVLGFNLLGDGFRDLFDPRLKAQR
jgi:peptide/nickel transport system permease protein